jgi:hypothetical protein
LRFCGLSKCEIHRVFREKYGVEWRQTDRYMARARMRGTPHIAPFQAPSPSCASHNLLQNSNLRRAPNPERRSDNGVQCGVCRRGVESTDFTPF